MKIAICDDNKANIASLEKLLQQYKVANGIELVCDTFYSSIDLIEDTSTKAYDLILLNVLMPGLSGIQTAKEIRLFDKIIKIIFLSSSSEFAVDSYSVGAYGYLLKPVNSDELFMLLDKILAEATGNSDAESLVIKSRASIVRIPFSNIEYVEVMNKTVSFHLNDVSVVDTSASLSDFEPQLLARVEFLKVHRSYLINLRYIQTLNAKAIVTQNGHTIPVSKMLYAQIKEAYMKYLFVNKPSPKPRKRKLPPITHTIGIYRILLVDDDPEQQNYWGRILQSKNCSVDFASDTETATKLAAGAVYDCIVLDVM
ncbi:MAG: response regulator, partial [Oscillospiraceae bacterium]